MRSAAYLIHPDAQLFRDRAGGDGIAGVGGVEFVAIVLVDARPEPFLQPQNLPYPCG